ncbi:unnamed protein product [Prorocentrum cordatum]|uniref:Uncharacterized protein n=1 Tax=Prorocentrum cordatum TaxID=2364126 RepID=A0ABN9VLH8_9DINO|nr:unnamed protein product [Polarella glacialis]
MRRPGGGREEEEGGKGRRVMRRGTLPAKAGHQLLRPHARARGAAKEGAAGATTPEAASLEKRSGWRAFSGQDRARTEANGGYVGHYPRPSHSVGVNHPGWVPCPPDAREALYSSRSHARRTRRARYYNG